VITLVPLDRLSNVLLAFSLLLIFLSLLRLALLLECHDLAFESQVQSVEGVLLLLGFLELFLFLQCLLSLPTQLLLLKDDLLGFLVRLSLGVLQQAIIIIINQAVVSLFNEVVEDEIDLLAHLVGTVWRRWFAFRH
jgi:hypothetical protein